MIFELYDFLGEWILLFLFGYVIYGRRGGKKGLFQLVAVRIFSGLVLAVILFIRVLRLMLN